MFLVLACASFFTTPPSGRLATANIDWHEMGFVKEIKLNPKVAPTTRSAVAWSYDPEPEDVHWHEMGLVRTLRVKDARARTTAGASSSGVWGDERAGADTLARHALLHLCEKAAAFNPLSASIARDCRSARAVAKKADPA